MAAGSLAAHSLSYLFISARAGEGGGEVSERASRGSAGYLVLFLGLLVNNGWRRPASGGASHQTRGLRGR
jgi:hypothetical protein